MAANKFRIAEKGNLENSIIEIEMINRVISHCNNLEEVQYQMKAIYPDAELIYRGGTHVSIHFTANTPRVMIVETEFAG